MRVEEHTTTIDHVPVIYRTAGAGSPERADDGSPERAGAGSPERAGAATPVVYLHGAATSSEIWVEFLERTGGLAPDLIGFGGSGKGGHLDYSPGGLTNFVERWLEHVGVERLTLVGHGWGAAIGLLLACRDPNRIERVVLINAVPLLGGFRWPRVVRMWRQPLLGELVMGATTRWLFDRELRRGAVRPQAWSPAQLKRAWEQYDQGTQRALLRLHRAADEPRLAELGAGLAGLGVPALVVWGERDPWLSPEFAEAYAAVLPDASVQRVAQAGHWPWLDHQQVIEQVASFVGRG